MKNADYILAKDAVKSGRPITKQTMAELKEMNAQYVKHIKKLAAKGDTEQAMWFREEQMEIMDVISAAKVE